MPLKDLEAESAESKLEVTSLTLENDSLRTGMEEMETRIKVLAEALQLQLGPQVVRLERNSSWLGVRARSFEGVGSDWMMGISVAEGGRDHRLWSERMFLKPLGLRGLDR
jgi:hypothetical protein